MRDQKQILRRIAERGLKRAQEDDVIPIKQSEAIDLWQHILDEILRLPE